MYDESTRKLPHTVHPHRRGADPAAHPDGNLIDHPRNPVHAERVARICPTCGYTASYASEPLANYHHPRHSCAKAQYSADAARRRTIGGPIRDCQHRGRPHLHGTRTAYVKDQCRCAECRAANSTASKTAHRERVLGRWAPFVDAAPVRAHIETLREAGIGVDQIALLAGISSSHVRELVPHARTGRRPIQRVRPETAQRLLAIAVTSVNRASRSHVDATGTRRRLQALVAIGWAQQALAAELGRSTTSLARTMTSEAVTARTARQVGDLYERLWDQQPQPHTEEELAASNAARALAESCGWPPPMAWDDIDTEPNPYANPPDDPDDDDLDEIVIERALAGDGMRLEHLTLAEQNEVVRRLTERGRSIRDIADQLGTTKRTVSRRRLAAHAA
jgi:predicted transcriptional regulator